MSPADENEPEDVVSDVEEVPKSKKKKKAKKSRESRSNKRQRPIREVSLLCSARAAKLFMEAGTLFGLQLAELTLMDFAIIHISAAVNSSDLVTVIAGGKVIPALFTYSWPSIFPSRVKIICQKWTLFAVKY